MQKIFNTAKDLKLFSLHRHSWWEKKNQSANVSSSIKLHNWLDLNSLYIQLLSETQWLLLIKGGKGLYESEQAWTQGFLELNGI